VRGGRPVHALRSRRRQPDDQEPAGILFESRFSRSAFTGPPKVGPLRVKRGGRQTLGSRLFCETNQCDETPNLRVTAGVEFIDEKRGWPWCGAARAAEKSSGPLLAPKRQHGCLVAALAGLRLPEAPYSLRRYAGQRATWTDAIARGPVPIRVC
jgi:hypothetical protein